MTDVRDVKRRLAPWLDEPFFVVQQRDFGANRCDHVDAGVKLNTVDRRCYCRECGLELDPFEALLNYAHAEQRLVSTRKAIEEARKKEEERKAAARARRPFVRRVLSRAPVKDTRLKAEPVVGYVLQLDCGHAKRVGSEWNYRTATCDVCRSEEKKNTLRPTGE